MNALASKNVVNCRKTKSIVIQFTAMQLSVNTIRIVCTIYLFRTRLNHGNTVQCVYLDTPAMCSLELFTPLRWCEQRQIDSNLTLISQEMGKLCSRMRHLKTISLELRSRLGCLVSWRSRGLLMSCHPLSGLFGT